MIRYLKLFLFNIVENISLFHSFCSLFSVSFLTWFFLLFFFYFFLCRSRLHSTYLQYFVHDCLFFHSCYYHCHHFYYHNHLIHGITNIVKVIFTFQFHFVIQQALLFNFFFLLFSFYFYHLIF